MNILLIEDNPGDVRLVLEMLKETRDGFTIKAAERLVSGMKLLQSEPFDVVLLDLNLPDSKGLETLTRLQKEFPLAPVVIMTSIDDVEVAGQAVRLGAQDYLPKGHANSELLQRTLAYAIRRKRARMEVETSRTFLDIANRCNDFDSLLDGFVHKTMEITRCDSVGIRLLNESGEIPYHAHAGFSARFYRRESPLSIRFDKCTCVNVIKGTIDPNLPFYTSNGSFYINGTTKFLATVSEEDKKEMRNVCNAEGYESVSLIPIRLGDKIIGLIHIADHKENMIPLNTVKLFEQVASALGISIQRALAQEQLKKRTIEMEALNRELEAFSYSVSHDLRSPLRAITGFSRIVLDDYGEKLDPKGKRYLNHIHSSGQLMEKLIDDLLRLSRINRTEMRLEKVNMSELAGLIMKELAHAQPEHKPELLIEPALITQGDPSLVKILLQNILGNAWKYTGKTKAARIEVGATQVDGERVFFIRDNGIGFDMSYAKKLFQPFQRLHTEKEFPGTGIGLAIVQRIINRHGGRVWAVAQVGQGATFYFTFG